MKLRVFTLRLDRSTGRFDDGDLQAFLEDTEVERDVIEVKESFFENDGDPLWALLVTYREARRGRRLPRKGSRRDWRAELDERERALFDALRLWRAETAKREGLPVYLICNNRHLAEISRERPTTLEQLRMINGLGEGKVGRFGEEILGLVSAGGEPTETVEERTDPT